MTGRDPSFTEPRKAPENGLPSMRSHSRNFMLSASASRSGEDASGEHPQNVQPPPHPSQAYMFQAGPGVQQGQLAQLSHGTPHPGHAVRQQYLMPQHNIPNLGELYCQVQEMDARLRHLELFVFTNPVALSRPPTSARGIADQQVAAEDANQNSNSERSIHVPSATRMLIT